jgi:limonene 1,2-monooxygenase
MLARAATGGAQDGGRGMASSSGRLGFGMFMAPFHPAIQNPTLSLQRDLELIELLDRLGFDEVWVGEHHSAGTEIISSPEVFIAAAAERTRRIKLGTGVVSLPYHHPLWVADRAMLLDHLTRGRFMLGVGPGSLPTDAAMVGLEPELLRPRLEEGLQAVLHLLSSDEPLSMETEWFTLRDAVLQLRPYTKPRIEIAVPGVASPTGARLAGKYGISLLTIGAAAAQGIDQFAMHWDVVEQQAAQHGRTTDRSQWRVLSMVHLAETEEQARKDVAFGITEWFRYFQHVAAFPQMAVEGENVDEMIEFVNGNGLGVVGTPEMLVELLQGWQDQSGGFGTCMLLHHEWANPEATRRSHELLSRFVMPEFDEQAGSLRLAKERASLQRRACPPRTWPQWRR